MLEEKLGECIAVMQDNSEKTKQLVSELEKERAESKSKDKIIKWLILAVVISCIANMVCHISTDSKEAYISSKYFSENYGYGEINAGGDISNAGGDING